MEKTLQATISVIDVQTDRVRLYPQKDGQQRTDYYVIASLEEAQGLEVGDVMEYKPEGFNFGWFVAKK